MEREDELEVYTWHKQIYISCICFIQDAIQSMERDANGAANVGDWMPQLYASAQDGPQFLERLLIIPPSMRLFSSTTMLFFGENENKVCCCVLGTGCAASMILSAAARTFKRRSSNPNSPNVDATPGLPVAASAADILNSSCGAILIF